MNTRPLAIPHITTTSNSNNSNNSSHTTTPLASSSNNNQNQNILSTSINSSHTNHQETDVPSDDLLTPTIITWNGGGHVVYVTGTFNRWRRKIKMLKSSPSDEDFTTVIQLPVGTHQLKFIVDDEWRCSDDLATAPDVNGNLVNYITVDSDVLSNDWEHYRWRCPSYSSSPDGSYTSERPAYLDLALQSHIIPGSNASVRRMQPPALPPHLEHVILNNATVSRDDDSALPAPHHVELNHLYACSIRDGVMAMATTKRYREKYITTVYYKPVFH
ncbi:hypothetical protein BDF22DRAFT_674741 [Syncephalis plumigaleata]|nr:hypothetical protein BDF22DRAFT_674741 [Syncephalis plumigaleata]